MTTTARTHLKTWTRRVLGTTLTLILTVVTLAGVVLAGVVVSSRSIHQPVPTGSTDAPRRHSRTPSPASRRTPPRRARSAARRRVRRGHPRHHRQRPPRAVRHLLELAGVHDLRRRRRRHAGTPRGRAGPRPDAHVRRRRRRPRPEARRGRRARPHQAHRRSRGAAAQLGGPPARGRGEGPRRVQRLDGARRHRDARRAGRHQPLVAHQRPGEEPPRRALDARPSLRRGRVRDHHGGRHLRCPGRTAPGRRARRTRRGTTRREPAPGTRLDPDTDDQIAEDHFAAPRLARRPEQRDAVVPTDRRHRPDRRRR